MTKKLGELKDFKPKEETPEELEIANKELHEILLGLKKCNAMLKKELAEKARRENK